ncbi:MAG TPA: DUF885 family protein [Gemmatimonadaceae bacterium]|jgi:uncharacterized protein (DUF885 family)|nr:DUF885 family protein [Gemmatimonadaceae bacterium]
MMRFTRIAVASLLAPLIAAGAQGSVAPNLAAMVGAPQSELVNVVNRFSVDYNSMRTRYDAEGSPDQRRRMREFYTDWTRKLSEVDFDKLSQEGRIDYVLLNRELKHELVLLDRRDKQRTEERALLPFADQLLSLQDSRRNLKTIDARAAAATLASAIKQMDSLRALIESPPKDDSKKGPAPIKVSRTIANRAANDLDAMKRSMGSWYRYYDGYDPTFTWWMKDPYKKLDDAMTRYARTIREKIVGFKAGEGQSGSNTGPIVGDPIGRKGLEEELAYEMIPYTPEQLIDIAEREYAFSLSEIKKASRELGFGDNWKAAMEKVKNLYVDPGKQPDLIRDLAREAEAFVEQHDYVTIPPLAKEDWRMEMMSPERQRVAPFFLGGDLILVSYPTADMTEEEKMMSLRGNNPHFSRATVFHELNPGHHLQGFMADRYNSHRSLFWTPFWGEGQSLYWEMFLWDHGFQVKPEDRIGALFWRMHRSARIIFSLSFHLGKMTPEQAVEFLVDTVNFERANAEGEVRRSFSGDYSPLYQMAYMIGGLQLRALNKELVGAGKMTDKQFHDAVLQSGPMPISLERARLENIPLTREGPAPWKFAESLPPPVPAPVKRP